MDLFEVRAGHVIKNVDAREARQILVRVSLTERASNHLKCVVERPLHKVRHAARLLFNINQCSVVQLQKQVQPRSLAFDVWPLEFGRHERDGFNGALGPLHRSEQTLKGRNVVLHDALKHHIDCRTLKTCAWDAG